MFRMINRFLALSHNLRQSMRIATTLFGNRFLMSFFSWLFGRSSETKTGPAPHPRPTQPMPPTQPTVDSLDLLNKTFRFIAVDVETANADVASICQIGLCCVDENGQTMTLGTLINPKTRFDAGNIGIHGIDAETVRDAPLFDDIIQQFRAFLERHPLVQHSPFDKRAIDAACAKYEVPKLRAKWFDSVTIARQAWPELKGNGGHGLAMLKVFLDLDFEHHDAEEDARAAALVVLRAEAKTGQSFDELATTKSRYAKQYPTSVAVEGRQDGPLFGNVACFTGKLSITRTQAATMAAGAGITVRQTVTKKTTLLVVGDQDLEVLAGHDLSTKHRRALELIEAGQTIRILGETEFKSLITS